jgi:membrane protease YdiL (CAAX protease family)
MRDRIVDFIRRRPLLTLLLVFNTFGQLVAFLPVIARRRYGIELDVDLVLIIPTIFFLLLPALLITRIAHGEAALRALLRSVVKFDVAPGWYLLPFVVIPVSVMALAFAAPPEGFDISTVAAAYLTAFLPALVFQFATTNWWEEAVWMGFFQATLQQRFTPMKAVLITTPFFALQHLFIAFESSPLEGAVTFAALTVVIVFIRALLAWIYNRTGSIALVGLTHASTNAVSFSFMPLLYKQNGQGALVLLLLGLAVIVATRGRLGLPHRRPAGTTTPAQVTARGRRLNERG